MSYTFLDASASVQSADSSIVSGTVQRPIINVASILGSLSVTVTGTPSVSGTVLVNNGSVVAFQGTNPWVIGSIVGTYSEDATHTTADKGLFTMGVRNDAVASFVSANLEYTPRATDSAGRTLTRPFAAEEARVEGYNSLTSTSVTTLVAAAGAGLRNYITDIFVANTGAATTLITFKDGAGSTLGATIAPTGGGSNIIGMATPMRTGANATFDWQPATASSVLYCTVTGYKGP